MTNTPYQDWLEEVFEQEIAEQEQLMPKKICYTVELVVETTASKELLESPDSWPDLFVKEAQDQSILEEHEGFIRSIDVSVNMIDEITGGVEDD